MDSVDPATCATGGSNSQVNICIEQLVLNRTVEGVVRGFKEVLWPWGFDVLPDPPPWQGAREMSSEEEEEMLVRAISVAQEEQIQALWSMWKRLHAWGFHVVPLVWAAPKHVPPQQAAVGGEKGNYGEDDAG